MKKGGVAAVGEGERSTVREGGWDRKEGKFEERQANCKRRGKKVLDGNF